ncbi:MAG: DNA-directed RNA polymerase subunit alpha, partial [Clostridiales bacterium]|nr:DNA-directed RNA polymerase subunit alpha [Clostridiales bacterium]
MIGIEKPEITFKGDKDSNECTFILNPLERGYGLTLGNSLRRVLLSSLNGYAITTVKIDGVLHEFGAIEGVTEDITEIILNLKHVILKIHGSNPQTNSNPQTMYIDFTGPGELTAGDIQASSDVEIKNPELHIATLNEDAHIRMELTADAGRGYVTAERNKENLKVPIGVIAIDSIYTPVLNVNYQVDNWRVGNITDLDSLTLNVTTNGTISAG